MDTKNFALTLIEVSAAWRNALDKRLKPLGLSQAKWRVLYHLSVLKTPLSQIELARRLGIEGPTLVGLLDRLAKDGWLTRKDANADRRCKAVHLTEKACATLKKIHSAADKLRSELLADIPASKLLICEQVLVQIKNKAGEAI